MAGRVDAPGGHRCAQGQSLFVHQGRQGQSTSEGNEVTRRRPVVQLTLSDDARKRLDEMATRCGETRSGMVERLVREAEMPRPKTTGKPVV